MTYQINAILSAPASTYADWCESAPPRGVHSLGLGGSAGSRWEEVFQVSASRPSRALARIRTMARRARVEVVRLEVLQ